jgi:hypothetical protein
MKLLKSLFFLAVVSLPLCVSVYSTINTDEECLEFVENLNEEEESDDKESEGEEELDFFKNHFAQNIVLLNDTAENEIYFPSNENVSSNQHKEVQTPPPEELS